MAIVVSIPFDDDEFMHVELVEGSVPPYLPVALEFQGAGVRVEQHEPNPEGGIVRHVSFIPYSNIKRIYQSVLVGGN
jgi:hypothetical protein